MADISFSEDEFCLGVGEHFYDPSIGGDTETRVLFEASARGGWSDGNIDDWVSAADSNAATGLVEVEDNSDYDMLEWA